MCVFSAVAAGHLLLTFRQRDVFTNHRSCLLLKDAAIVDVDVALGASLAIGSFDLHLFFK